MNKTELILETSKKAKLSSEDCKRCLDAITELICEVLKRGDKVYISGFGKFETKIVSEHLFYNPIAETKQMSSQKIVPIFKSGKKLKEKMLD
ncbi:MAG: HU family DNA-binding protein [Clostridia bacterium]|nr:HU family DNA-binding protein [Clostridia bacterium]